MTGLILHHYPQSLFSEKARAMLNARGLAWRSVIIPMIMPRPDTIPLTGGYRRTPVLQVGADVYCDTALIATFVDERGEGDSFYPAASRLAANTLSRWVDTELFWAAVTLRFQPQSAGSFFADAEAAAAFAKDRAEFSQGAAVRRIPLQEAEPRYRVFLGELEAQLMDGRAWLFGGTWSIADFSVYHVLWFLNGGGPAADSLAGNPASRAWYERMRALGARQGEFMSPAAALDAALRSAPEPLEGVSELADIPLGSMVDVAPTDYGVMPSRGELLHADDRAIVIRRQHERTGPVHVHFPRLGFGVTKVAT